MSKKQITFALAGNPNCGKTTIFNALTGARQKVGNWGGVTVEKKEGIFSRDNTEFHLVDLPGTYSLSAYSIEERIARDYILTGEAEVTCVIIDASNLERNLYLVTQLLEMQTRMVLVFNMMDEVEAKGTVIDFKKISKLFGVPVIPAVANRCRGMNEILDAVEQVAAKENKVKHVPIRYPREIESALKDISSELDSIERGLHQYPRAWLALKLLENDKNIREMLKGQTELLKKVDENRKNINQLFKDDAEMIITDHRYGFINGALKEVVSQSKKKKADTTDKVDRILIHRVLGIPILFFMLWFMFESTFTLGAYPMDWIGTAMGWISSFFTSIMEPGLFRSLIVDGIIAGVGGVAIFLPNILILFLFIALMEDTGYMARAAFVMDRIMHSVGLHGKSFIPLLMGFGCNVPAIMGTRVLESKRDRILTILINPFMSCSARLPVYVLFAGAFFTAHAGSVIFGLYILGVLIAVFSGMLFSRTLLKGQGEPFVMELPPYRLPTMRSLVIHMWERAVIFLKKMGGVIMVGSIVIWALSTFPQSDEIDTQIALEKQAVQKSMSGEVLSSELSKLENKRLSLQQENSLLARFGKSLEPVLSLAGFDWRDGVALTTGFVAKEVVISTLGILYGVGEEVDEESTNLAENIKASGKSSLWALAFMVFVLVYSPCISTIAAIRRETSNKWMWFQIIYSLSIAFILAVSIWQVGSLLGY